MQHKLNFILLLYDSIITYLPKQLFNFILLILLPNFCVLYIRKCTRMRIKRHYFIAHLLNVDALSTGGYETIRTLG